MAEPKTITIDPGTDDMEHMAGWTAQSANLPEPPAGVAPALVHVDQLPDADQAAAVNLIVPEHLVTDDATLLDPADQVRVGNPDYASPLGVTANPEGAHIPGDTAAPAVAVADLSSMTKSELLDEADLRGVTADTSMTKAEILAAIEAG